MTRALILPDCEACGIRIERKPTGRPKKLCPECYGKHRQEYQHERYLKRKYPGLTRAEIEKEEIIIDIKRDHNKLKRAIWASRHIYHHPYWDPDVRVCLDPDRSFRERESIAKPIRKVAMKLLKEHEAHHRI